MHANQLTLQETLPGLETLKTHKKAWGAGVLGLNEPWPIVRIRRVDNNGQQWTSVGISGHQWACRGTQGHGTCPPSTI